MTATDRTDIGDKELLKLVDGGYANRVAKMLELRNSQASLATVFERAVTDFRTIKRNRGHSKILMSCIDLGLDPMTRADWMNQPLICTASMYGNLRIVSYIAEHVGLADCPFVRASIGDVEFLKELDASSLKDLRDENGFCLMHYAVGSGLGRIDDESGKQQEETCKFLIEQDVPTDLVVENNIGITPALLCAWFCGSPDIMQMLIDAGEVNVGGLHQAIEFAFEPHQRNGEPFSRVADVILKNGFDINSIRPDQNRTVLHGSANRGSTTAVTWLLDNGADPNVLDDQQRTPLHSAAVRNSHASVAQLLIAAGANVELADANGKTALHLAEEEGRKKVAEFLRIQ
jgi:ankyrin repeat protein